MNRTNQLLCIHMTWVFVVLVGGAFVVAGWIPPPSPNRSSAEIAENFRDHDNVRVAAAMFFFGGALFVAPCAAITAQLRRIEGPRDVLGTLQIVSAAIGVLALQIPGALWLAISYRDGVDPSVVVALNDVAWFFLLGAVGSAVMQNFAIGACILGSDGSVYPRWMGYISRPTVPTQCVVSQIVTSGLLCRRPTNLVGTRPRRRVIDGAPAQRP